jgi:PPOX class probable F420-dependent enzyme
MRTLNDSEIWEFLEKGGRTDAMATVGADGHPHVVPVWYIVDRGEIVVTIMSSSAKARDLARDPRVAVTVDDERPPFAFVALRGIATLLRDSTDLLQWTTRIAGRYVPDHDAARLGPRNAEIDDTIVRIRITRAIGWTEVTA